MELQMWDSKDVKYLIQLLKRHRLLYDMTDRLYTNTKAREKALAKIAKELCAVRQNTTPCEVKEKIRILRAQFIAELHTQQQMKEAGEGDEYETKLWCFDLLQFLNPSTTFANNTAQNSDLNSVECAEEEEYVELQAEEYLSETAPEVPIKVRRKLRRKLPARRDDHEKYRDRQYNNDNIETLDISGYNSFTGKKVGKKLKKKYERAFAAIQIAKQFANKYSQKQKTSKNLMFSNFICDELDDITHADVLDEVKWDIQEIIRNALKRDKELTRNDAASINTATVTLTDEDMHGAEILYNLEI